MTTHSTVADLTERTLEKLKELVQINVDSAKGFELAAEKIDDVTLAEMFRGIAADRRRQVDELSGFVAMNGEVAEREGSYLASFHRSWMKFRDAITGGSNVHAILSEAEYGEDQIKDAYEDALIETAGSPVNAVLTRQFADVKSAHDRVRDLRDARADD